MTTTPRPTLSLTVRGPDDLLAAAPVLLGFWPEESVVLMTSGARHPFHARMDLPSPGAPSSFGCREVAEALLEPAVHYGVSHVALLYYADDPAAADEVHRSLRRACRRRGLVVVRALHADRTHYRELDHPDPSGRRRRWRYDVSAHPFVVEALVSGRLAHRSRADLVASLDPDPAAVGAVGAALVAGRFADAGVPVDGRAIRAAGDWVHRVVRDLTAVDALPGDADLARLLWVMQAGRVRDAAWSAIVHRTAAAHVRLWTDAVRRAPDALVAAPAALLGWAAWQAGDGALAWVAVDRCTRAEPGYRMAAQLGSILQAAVPPQSWQGGFAWDEGLPEAPVIS
ncbi:DUF4192 domain-containing protein [Nocardioides daeguensis]|uniref:DUF4192 domain-containing protein n=1 Tax=Nocardioides daeguensis TaxID=908359 RepID=A0ABP6UWD4_9ACTN|nr:DUF4192 domain-containing protein [Nocardioides daeguensis]MBV6725600.1 DUF4192 domain-containing protein [Nocardioides daeguensis]MCR1772885.1 DUF4192 domain-containing protein [Nocardioides daeguensis]